MDERQRTVRYVTRDPIQNLKIKVVLIRISALARAKTKLHTPEPARDQQQDAPAAGGAAGEPTAGVRGSS
jgi:hypothetical protein